MIYGLMKGGEIMFGRKLKHEKANDVVIYKTTDYGRFVQIKGNREVDKEHVRSLVRSIKRRNLLAKKPILVMELGDNALGIVDGQHRLAAAKVLSLPIYYDIGEDLDLDDVRVLNTTVKNWSLKHSLHRYVELGNKDYKELKGFIKDYNIPFTNSMAILASTPEVGRAFSAYYEKFREGEFISVDIDKKKEFAELATQFKPYLSTSQIWSQRAFMKALWKVWLDTDVDVDKLIKKYQISKTPDIMYSVSVIDYLRQFEDVYNENRKNRVRFY